MNTETITVPIGDWRTLQERLARVAAEKSSLQLAVHLMGRLGAVSGLANTLEGMLRGVLEVIGGTHGVVYYWIDGATHVADVLGRQEILDRVHDPLVLRVMSERRLVEDESDFEQTKMLTPPFTKSVTWVFPLLVGQDLLGVFKMEGMHVAPAELKEALPTFFSYAALVLKNEILGHTKLRKAHDELAREVGFRKQAEAELRKAKDGLEVEVAERTAALVEANSQLARELAERRKAEDEIRRLSSAVEQSPVSIVITDPNAAIEYVNPKFTAVTGYELQEVMGKNPRLLKGHKTTPEEYRAMWASITQGKAWRGEFLNRKKNGELFWESVLISPIFDARGRIVHFLAVKEDITRQKAMEEQLREVQKLESIGQLAGGVAHDFNNILAAITLHLDLLRVNPGLDDDTRGSLQELLRDVDRAAKLTRQLLMFGRRSVLEVQVLDLTEVVSHLLQMLGRLIGEHIHLRFESVNGLPLVEADRGMIEQVLVNLALNARDAMPHGGTLSIGLSAIEAGPERVLAHPEAQPGRHVCVSVQDTGCGMGGATLRHIFEPFFTTKSLGRGTGLGLATAHGIVAQHKGWIEVESEAGQGSTFRVILPASTKPAPTVDTSPRPVAMRGQGTILLVEDEPTVRRSMRKGIASMGYTVLEACNGAEALKIWREGGRSVDLLLSDMIMPGGLTGLDVAQQMRKEQPSLRVIIASGYNSELIQLGAAVASEVTYLQKPFALDVLASTIRGCMEGEGGHSN